MYYANNQFLASATERGVTGSISSTSIISGVSTLDWRCMTPRCRSSRSNRWFILSKVSCTGGWRRLCRSSCWIRVSFSANNCRSPLSRKRLWAISRWYHLDCSEFSWCGNHWIGFSQECSRLIHQQSVQYQSLSGWIGGAVKRKPLSVRACWAVLSVMRSI